MRLNTKKSKYCYLHRFCSAKKTTIVVFIKTHGTQIYQNNPMTHFFSKTLKLMGPIVGTQGNLHNSWDKLKNLRMVKFIGT